MKIYSLNVVQDLDININNNNDDNDNKMVISTLKINKWQINNKKMNAISKKENLPTNLVI